jgi:hypothetical protein
MFSLTTHLLPELKHAPVNLASSANLHSMAHSRGETLLCAASIQRTTLRLDRQQIATIQPTQEGTP